jgi:hypothetical protein
MQPRDPELFRLMCAAVTEGLEQIRQLPKHQFIPPHYGWGSIGQFDNGLPHFNQSYGGGAIDYSQAFGDGAETAPLSNYSRDYPIQVRGLKTFAEVIDYAVARPRFFDFFTNSDSSSSDDREWWPRYSALRDLVDTIDRYIHAHGMTKLDPELFLPMYMEWENGIFGTEHSVQLLVPFLLTKFEFESAPLANGVTIERMNEGIQLSRMMMLEHRYEAHPLVASAASHALVLDNYSIQVQNHQDAWHIASDPTGFPLEIIDLAFAAIRTVSGLDTGYAQLLVRPIGWARRWTANLPSLHGSNARRYPSQFDDAGWLQPAPTIDSKTTVAIGQLLEKLLPHREGPLGAACRRLNDCFLREREDDALVDALIAIETLLSDNELGEITH